MTFIDWTIIAFFLGALIVIGYLFSKKNRNIEDYFMAGRSMPGWLVAIHRTRAAACRAVPGNRSSDSERICKLRWS